MTSLGVTKNLACYDAVMKPTFVIYAITLAMGSVLFAQSKPTTLAKIYVGSEGLAHVVDDNGKEIRPFTRKRIKLQLARQNCPLTGWQQVG